MSAAHATDARTLSQDNADDTFHNDDRFSITPEGLAALERSRRAAELQALWLEYADNRSNTELRNKLLENYKRLLYYVVRSYLRLRDIPVSYSDEFLGAAWIAMAQAAEAYDPRTAKWQFTTAMIRQLRWRLPRLMRTSSDAAMRYQRIESKRHRASHRLGHRANDYELANDIGQDERDTTREIQKFAGAIHVFGGDDHGLHVGANIEDPSDRITLQDTYQRVSDCIRSTDRELLTRLHMEGVTARAIAEERGVSYQRICQLNQVAIERVRAKLEGRQPIPARRTQVVTTRRMKHAIENKNHKDEQRKQENGFLAILKQKVEASRDLMPAA